MHIQEKDIEASSAEVSSTDSAGESCGQAVANLDGTHRTLKSRHIQMIGIGGTIGTALYVQIGKGLLDGGPGSLVLAFSLWCTFILSVTMCMAEMVTYMPISSPFIRFAGRYVDEAMFFASGWNFFIFQAVLVPFEIVACNMIIQFWTDAVHPAIFITLTIAMYVFLNVKAVKWYGESEFWASLGKVILIVALVFFTIFTMLGANPLGDRFGFRYWSEPGAFAEHYTTGWVGRLMGFIACLTQAAFTIAGPDYVSMSAGEAQNPRSVMPRAFNAVFYRLTSFFVLGSLCVGILVPYNDPDMTAAFHDGKPGAAASPYVVAMNRLNLPVLPHVVNAMVLTAAFSAGNSYVYCASRSLYGMALEGKAPRCLTKVTSTGVPIYSVATVLCISLLSFLQLQSKAAQVLNWFVALVTSSQLINFAVMCITYLGWYRATRVQNFDRNQLPYKSWLQPYAAWYGLIGCLTMALVGGFKVFLPGNWSTMSFLFSYASVFVFPCLFFGWKWCKKTKLLSASEMDLTPPELTQINEYEEKFIPVPPKNGFEAFLDKLFG